VREGLYGEYEFAEALDKSAIKVSKPNELLNLFHTSGSWPGKNVFDFLLAHLDTLCTYLKPNKFDFGDMENALVNIDTETIFW